MKTRGDRHPFYIFAGLLCASALLLSACADPTTASEDNSAVAEDDESIQLDKNPEAANLVPKEYRDAGSLKFGALLTGAPMMYVETDGEIAGAEEQLVDAIGQVLGIEVEKQEVSTDGFIPALQSKRTHFVAGSLTDIKERERVVDFVVYAEYGQALLTQADKKDEIAFDNLCGKAVGVAKGSVQQLELLPDVAEECESTGEPAPVASAFPDANALYLAVNSGRVDAGFLNEVTIRYQAKQSKGEMAVADTGFGTDPKGIAIMKDSGLAEPLLAAIKVIQDEGALAAIFDQWGISATMLPEPKLNQAVR